jgi:hypothetical protein
MRSRMRLFVLSSIASRSLTAWAEQLLRVFQRSRAPVFLDIHDAAVLDVIQAFADRCQRLFTERLLAAQLVDLLTHFGHLIVGERLD